MPPSKRWGNRRTAVHADSASVTGLGRAWVEACAASGRSGGGGGVVFVVQIGRLPGGQRRILSISEVTGVNDDVVAMQELHRHDPVATPDGGERDHWASLGVAPHSPKVTRYRQMLRRARGDAHA